MSHDAPIENELAGAREVDAANHRTTAVPLPRTYGQVHPRHLILARVPVIFAAIETFH